MKTSELAQARRQIGAWLKRHGLSLNDVGVECKSLGDLSDPDVLASLLDDIEDEIASEAYYRQLRRKS